MPLVETSMKETYLAREQRREDIHAFDILAEKAEALSEVPPCCHLYTVRVGHIMCAVECCSHLISWCDQAPKARIMTLADRYETEATPKTIRGILDTNAVGSASHDDATLEDVLTLGEHYKIRLHVTFSRFNHSCAPNCYVEEFDVTERAGFGEAENRYYSCSRIKAARDIEEGEELCITYIPLLKPREYRVKTLNEKYSFVCDCTACCPTPTASKSEAQLVEESDARRAQLDQVTDVPFANVPREEVIGFYDLWLRLLEEEKLCDPMLAFQAWQSGFIGRLKQNPGGEAKKKGGKDDPAEWLAQALLFANITYGPHVRATRELREFQKKL